MTDANVVLGVLNQTHLLGGRMPIDADLSFAAVDRLAGRLGMSRTDAAQGIISVVTANMARAIRVISVQRGYDPRDYALVAFGGAGPLHSARLAVELGMRTTLVPQHPGALSALGMLMTDLRSDYSQTRITNAVPGQAHEFDRVFAELRARADAWFSEEGVPATERRIGLRIDMRYVGQNYELPVDVLRRARSTRSRSSRPARRSTSCTPSVYGYASPRRAGRGGDVPRRGVEPEPAAGVRPPAARERGPGTGLGPGAARCSCPTVVDCTGLRPRAPRPRSPHLRARPHRAVRHDHARPARGAARQVDVTGNIVTTLRSNA